MCVCMCVCVCGLWGGMCPTATHWMRIGSSPRNSHDVSIVLADLCITMRCCLRPTVSPQTTYQNNQRLVCTVPANMFKPVSRFWEEYNFVWNILWNPPSTTTHPSVKIPPATHCYIVPHASLLLEHISLWWPANGHPGCSISSQSRLFSPLPQKL